MSTVSAHSRVGRREIAVSFSTRISLETRDLIDEVVAREGISIREVVEQAVLTRCSAKAGAA